jgi:hypothetical protein
MLLVRAATVVALLPCMLGAAEAAKAAKKNKNIVQGYVVSVEKGVTGEGSITLRLKAKKKQAAADATPVEKTYKLTTNTKFTIVAGKKGAVQEKAADASRLQKGDHIVLFHNGAEATDVKILKKKAKKKNT